MHSLMLTLRKSEGICRDSDYNLRYDYLQAYAADVYDKQIYFCSPNNFSARFLILSTVRLPLKLSLNDLKISVSKSVFFYAFTNKTVFFRCERNSVLRSEFLNSFRVFDAVEFLSSLDSRTFVSSWSIWSSF